MKFFSMIFFLFVSLTVFGQDDYVIYVNDTIFDLSLDKEYQLSINDKPITLRVKAKDTINYNNDLYRFKHLKEYKVSKMNIEEGIDQITLLTAEGSGIIIQQYRTLNPTMLNEMMINEVTKESVNYGFKLKRKSYKRKLKSGQTLQVDKAILSYKDELNVYEVASIGSKDQGIMIMTMRMDDNEGTAGEQLIELMWGSLRYK